MDNVLGAVKTSLDKSLRAVEEKSEARFNDMEYEISKIKNNIATGDKERKQMQETIEDLQKRVCKAERATIAATDIADDVWDRDPNPCVLKVGTPTRVGKDKVMVALGPWLESGDVGFGDNGGVTLDGPALGRTWTLRFKGAAGFALLKTNKCFDLLREEGGSWKEIYAEAPNGPNVRCYVSKDKSAATVKREILTKKACRIIREMLPKGKDVHANRRDGEVNICWQRAIRVVVHDRERQDLEFLPDVLALHKLSKKDILEAFNEKTGGPVDPGWCL